TIGWRLQLLRLIFHEHIELQSAAQLLKRQWGTRPARMQRVGPPDLSSRPLVKIPCRRPFFLPFCELSRTINSPGFDREGTGTEETPRTDHLRCVPHRRSPHALVISFLVRKCSPPGFGPPRFSWFLAQAIAIRIML